MSVHTSQQLGMLYAYYVPGIVLAQTLPPPLFPMMFNGLLSLGHTN